MIHYVAAYEDRAKVREAALKAGWDGQEGGPNDYVEPNCHRTSQRFASEQDAVAWLNAEIEGEKTYWGCGDVLVFEDVPRQERCDACTCFGKKLVRRYVVDDEGKADEETIDDCYYDPESNR